MNVIKLCEEYCIGCGMCESELDIPFKKDAKGYKKPMFSVSDKTEKFLKEVCPVTGLQTELLSEKDIWGKAKAVYAGYCTDAFIRKKASSGGVLTALALYLLESGQVDGIIQVKADSENPTMTQCWVSSTREEIIACCGSRYSISHPWEQLSNCIDEKKKYAAVGKPCDIAALRNLKCHCNRYENIIYLLSFFCAGLPSETANHSLVEELGCETETCQSLTYRGNGWPGFATAIDINGAEHCMEYSKAWGGILGRDIHPYCRLCIDGIGETADIACGDGWYIAENGEPDFSEREGRNIVFARNSQGEELLRNAVEAGMIQLSAWKELNQLQIIQKYQHSRRATMRAKLAAYRIMGRQIPCYNKELLKNYAVHIGGREKTRVFLGTIKRIVRKKI